MTQVNMLELCNTYPPKTLGREEFLLAVENVAL